MMQFDIAVLSLSTGRIILAMIIISLSACVHHLVIHCCNIYLCMLIDYFIVFVLAKAHLCSDTFDWYCDDKRQCLSSDKFCNGRVDCDDESDEVNCRKFVSCRLLDNCEATTHVSCS